MLQGLRADGAGGGLGGLRGGVEVQGEVGVGGCIICTRTLRHEAESCCVSLPARDAVATFISAPHNSHNRHRHTPGPADPLPSDRLHGAAGGVRSQSGDRGGRTGD